MLFQKNEIANTQPCTQRRTHYRTNEADTVLLKK